MTTITDADVEPIDDYTKLFWFTYGEDGRLEFYFEHPDQKKQKAGQDAIGRLAIACGLTDVSDASDFIGKEVHIRAIQEVAELIGGKRARPATPAVQSVVAPIKIDTRDGRFVYVISCVDSNPQLCKIGIANSAEKRVRTLGTSSPHPLRLEMARYCGSARTIEADAHAHFAAKRKNGEWFEMSPSAAIAYVNEAIDKKAA